MLNMAEQSYDVPGTVKTIKNSFYFITFDPTQKGKQDIGAAGSLPVTAGSKHGLKYIDQLEHIETES